MFKIVSLLLGLFPESAMSWKKSLIVKYKTQGQEIELYQYRKSPLIFPPKHCFFPPLNVTTTPILNSNKFLSFLYSFITHTWILKHCSLVLAAF